MSERKINLEEILNKELNILSIRVEQIEKSALKAMKEACRQVLELAAEKIKSDALEEYGSEVPDCWSEQSILDTINQVE